MSCKVLRAGQPGCFFSLFLAPALWFQKSGMGDEKSRNKGPASLSKELIIIFTSRTARVGRGE